MCGIAGIINPFCLNMSKEISLLTHAMTHRGPDDFGFAAFADMATIVHSKELDQDIKANVFFGHRRLSIIDLNGTCQPLLNEDSSVCVVFNGEIYNYMELAELLKKKGHVLKESGDTEVLVHLWEEYGENMTELLNGMFAFAIYDMNKNLLFLSRDRFGQKPLIYKVPSSSSESFVFASELNALKQLPCFSESISNNALAEYFRYGYIPSPKTAYENVFSLLPGHSLIIHLDNISNFKIKTYWKTSVGSADINSDIPCDEIQSLIDDSVRMRLITDVPTGGFLSGGIDSGIIAASAVKFLKQKYETYTVSTDSSWCDESKEARITADFLKTSHHEFSVKPDFVNIAEKLARHYGQPFADFSSIITYFICSETVRHIKVALSGDGGDEIFGGYNSYLNLGKYSFFGIMPTLLRNSLASLIPYSNSKQSDSLRAARLLPEKGENISCLFHEYWRKNCYTSEFLNTDSKADCVFSNYFNNAQSDSPVDKWMEADQKMYLCDDILHKVDIASMAVSLECRAPLLDFRLAELINPINHDLKLQNNTTKYILRKLASDRIPAEIVTLPKKGFSIPLNEWLRSDLNKWAESIIFDGYPIWENYLRRKPVERLWKEHQSGKYDHSARIWQIIAFNLAFSA